MSDEVDRELFRAVLAIAAADGRFKRSEKGVFENLAARVGVSSMDIWRMRTELRRDASAREGLLKSGVKDPEAAMKLLVATARIDGEVSPEEKQLLEVIAENLGLAGRQFARLYSEGILAADEIRKRKARAERR